MLSDLIVGWVCDACGADKPARRAASPQTRTHSQQLCAAKTRRTSNCGKNRREVADIGIIKSIVKSVACR